MSQPTATTPDDANRIEREHHELRQLIESIAVSFEKDPERSEGVAADLTVLSEKLSQHFAGEETGGGFYAQILEQDARFGPEIVRLTEEHAELLKLALSLTSGSVDPAELPNEFRRLQEALSQHEGDENRLMQQAYTDEIGSKD